MAPRPSLAVLCVLLVAAVGTPALAGPGETLTIENSLDVPDRVATYDGTNYTISAVRRADPGDTIRVSTTVVESDSYRVHIRNRKDDLVDSSNRLTENTTVSFNLTGYDPGTYLVGLNQDGSYRAIQPLVVRGFAVAATVPSEAQTGSEITVSADITRLRGSDDPTVQAVVGNDSHVVRVNATLRDGRYEATVSLDSLSPGTYAGYVVVRGPDRAFGEPELLGVSDRTDLDVTASDTGGTGSGGTGGGTGGSGGTGATPSGPTPTSSTESPTTTPTVSPSPTPTPGTPTSTSPTPTDGVITPRPTTSVPGTTTTAAPGSTTETPTDGTGTLQPGFGVLPSLAALVALAVLFLRRR